MANITAFNAGNQLSIQLLPESMSANLFDYDELVKTMIRVLTTGPERLAQLAALADPWEP